MTVRLTSDATAGTSITHTAASSDDGYDGSAVTIDGVTVTVAPAPPTRLTVSRSSLRIAEGLSGTYTVRLASAEAATVAVAATGSGDVTVVDPRVLTFVAESGETDSWNVAQTVTVMAAEDDDGVDDIATLTHTVGNEPVVSRKLVGNGHGQRQAWRDGVEDVTGDSRRGRRHLHRGSGYRADRDGDGSDSRGFGRCHRETVSVDVRRHRKPTRGSTHNK